MQYEFIIIDYVFYLIYVEGVFMIIVVGASGFIGTYLVDRLIEEGYEVTAVDVDDFGSNHYQSLKVPFIKLDISDSEILKILPVDNVEAVINLACVQPANVSCRGYDPSDYFRVNVIGALNLLEYCVKNNINKYFHTCSHRNTQGMWEKKKGKPIKEDDGRSLLFTGDYSIYSISESAVTDCIEHYNQTFNLQGIIFRIPPVYGYGPHTIIYKDGKPLKTGFQQFIDKAKQGQPLELWGDINRGRDIIYIKDVVSAYILALKKERLSGIFNISSGRKTTLKEEAECIAKEYWPKDGEPKYEYFPDKMNNIEPYVYDISKAKKAFGWTPKFTFAEFISDYRKEFESEKFKHLVRKRELMMERE